MGSREPRDVAAELKKGSHAEEDTDTSTKAPAETETDKKEKTGLSSADAARITAASVLAEASETIDHIVRPSSHITGHPVSSSHTSDTVLLTFLRRTMANLTI
jgi:hypothetical protein